MVHRQYPKGAFMMALGLMVSVGLACSGKPGEQHREQDAPVVKIGGPCEDCEGLRQGMPEELAWQTIMVSDPEPGGKMEIGGTIYQADGRTPAADIILYVYHTDANGYYSPAPGTTDAARAHGHLRGWMRTNNQGTYSFTTIRPASYPNSQEPAHIHAIVEEPGKGIYYIDEFVFDDDPFLTPERKERHEHRGGSGIISLARNSEGVWTGRRDIRLGYNIPGYK